MKTTHKTRRLVIYLIKPSNYDESGYVIRYWRGVLPSNSLTCLYGLTEDVRERGVLGPALNWKIELIDETVQRAIRDGINYLAVHYTDTARAAALADAAGLPFVVWTVRSEADLSAARPYNPAIIFEHIDPALAAP